MKIKITVCEPKGDRQIEIQAELRNADISGELIVSPGGDLMAALASPDGYGSYDFDIHGEAGAFSACRVIREEGGDIVIRHS